MKYLYSCSAILTSGLHETILKMILLEKFDHTCSDQLISWVDSAEELMQFAGPAFTFPLTKEQLEVSLSDPNRFAFKVIALSNETIGYAEIYLTGQSAYLGRILIGDPQKRGKGLGQQVVSCLLHYAFDSLDQTTVQLNVFEWNTSAIKCYEKAGFHINPDKRAERIVNGQIWIALNMTIDRQDWKR
jgi:RimJ/RimL family protein N-acetyltransferase